MQLSERQKYWGWTGLALLGIAVLTMVGPAEKSLGNNVRVVYLHGAWVWASLAGFVAAGTTGMLGLLRRSEALMKWSRALGRCGLFFWITYLPISIWAMETNWNGLFLAEPRFRLAVIFSVAGLLLQLGVTLLEHPKWAAAGNTGYILVLLAALRLTPNVMHPPAPILNSDVLRIQGFFALLLLFTLALAWQIARWFYQFERSPQRQPVAPRQPAIPAR